MLQRFLWISFGTVSIAMWKSIKNGNTDNVFVAEKFSAEFHTHTHTLCYGNEKYNPGHLCVYYFNVTSVFKTILCKI